MYCENKFCVYENNNECVGGDIELDISGICQSCILINIDDELLRELKNKTFESMEKP